jgi:protein ImuB
MKRVISLWLPTFQTDRMTRTGAPQARHRDHPFATLAPRYGALVLSAVNGAAQAEGVGPGLPLADARALLPHLTLAEADPTEDARVLEGLADWCGRFTPLVAEENPGDGSQGQGAGLWLDITGCAHLFGGEGSLLRTIRDALTRLGFDARLGLADTPGAAWAAARFMTNKDGIALLPEGAHRQLLGSLPLAALRLSLPVIDTLRRLGARDIAALASLPRGPLATRLGLEALRRLDQALGRLPEPLSPRRPVAPDIVRLSFPEPIATTSAVSVALDRLLVALLSPLERERRGARMVELSVYRVDGSVSRCRVGTNLPTRDPAHLARLFQDRLGELDAGFGIEAMALGLLAADGLSPAQEELTRAAVAEEGRPREGSPRAAQDLALLADRLMGRLGSLGGPRRPLPHPAHQPERTTREAPLGSATKAPAQSKPVPSEPVRFENTPAPNHAVAAARPARLFPRPLPARVTVGPEGAPQTVALSRQGAPQKVLHHAGPERIDPDWWLEEDAPSRAYWRVEAEDGRRLWLFRGLFRGDARWFVHGIFP